MRINLDNGKRSTNDRKSRGCSMIRAGNVGVITTIDDITLFEITAIQNGLVYCMPLVAPYVTRICLPDQFWTLLDEFWRGKPKQTGVIPRFFGFAKLVGAHFDFVEGLHVWVLVWFPALHVFPCIFKINLNAFYGVILVCKGCA
jgi:hypothetical protein